MCADLKVEAPGTRNLFNLLSTGGKLDYLLESSRSNRTGTAAGRLLGGNLSMLSLLAGTSYDLISRYARYEDDKKGAILFFEDSGISFRRVRDILLSFYLSGDLLLVKGLIFGSFNKCKPYGKLCSIEDVVSELEERWMIPSSIPIVFNFPIGEGETDIPLPVGIEVELEVTNEQVSLKNTSKKET